MSGEEKLSMSIETWGKSERSCALDLLNTLVDLRPGPWGVGASGMRVCSLCVGFMSDWHAKKLRFHTAFLALEMVVPLVER